MKSVIRMEFKHRVFFTRGLFRPDNFLLSGLLKEDPAPFLVVFDKGLVQSRPSILRDARVYFKRNSLGNLFRGEPLVLPGGEEGKVNPFYLKKLYGAIEQSGLCKKSMLIAIGGGGVLDVVGFVAATAHRGMRLLRIPSTVLSQADGGVGIKNGVNFLGVKNFIGTMAPPHAVINDFDLISTLPRQRVRSGYAEAVKVALIRDRSFFESLEDRAPSLVRFEARAIEWLIRNCARQHVEHIAGSGDPFERRSSRPLDFGHWSAHRLEGLTRHQVSHGDAVAMGMAWDVLYSKHAGLLKEGVAERILGLLERLGFQLFHDQLLSKGKKSGWKILRGLEDFRQHLGGELNVTLLKGIGRPVSVHQMDRKLLRKAALELAGRYGRGI